MTEAYIVATARSPIGRARKGSLAGIRPDDLTARMVQAALDEVPGLDPAAHRGPDARLRAARRRAGLQPRAHRRGAARARRRAGHDGEPVLLVVAADHPHGVPRHQGGGGGCLRLGRRRVASAATTRGASDLPGAFNPALRVRTDAARRSARPPTRPPGPTRATSGELPDAYIAMGQTAENVAQLRGITREEQDAFAARSQQRAEAAIALGLLAARHHTGHSRRRHGRLRRRRAPRRRDGRGARGARPGVPPGRHRHGGQLLPPQRRRGGGRDRVGPGGGRARPRAPRSHRLDGGRRALARDHGARVPWRPRAGRSRGPGSRSTTSTWSRSTRPSPRR